MASETVLQNVEPRYFQSTFPPEPAPDAVYAILTDFSNLSISSLFNVEGKIVLVTGGGSGIGKMMASGFAANGAKVYIAARKEKQLQESVADINKIATGPKAQYIVANLNVSLSTVFNPGKRCAQRQTSRRRGAMPLLKSSRNGNRSCMFSLITLGLPGEATTMTSRRRRAGTTSSL